MAKYDAVDRLMKQATAQPTLPKEQAVGPKDPAPEPKNPPTEPEQPPISPKEAATTPEQQTKPAPTQPAAAIIALPTATPGERGRQLLGALRPFLPIVSGALRTVDHGAVQAVARLLPLLGSIGSSGSSGSGSSGSGSSGPSGNTSAQPQPGTLTASSQPPAALLHQQTLLQEELKRQSDRLIAQEDQLRRLRENQERLSAEQGTLAHRTHQLQDRSRLLTAGLIVVVILIAAESILLALALRR